MTTRSTRETIASTNESQMTWLNLTVTGTLKYQLSPKSPRIAVLSQVKKPPMMPLSKP